MEHIDAFDTASLEAEVEAMIKADALQSARIDALLQRTAPQPMAADSALRRLQRTARHAARLGDLIERQQSQLEAQLDGLGM